MIEAAIPLESVVELSRKDFTSPASEQLTQKFEALMQKPDAKYEDAAHVEKTSNALTVTLNKEEDVIRKIENDIAFMGTSSKYLTPVELDIAAMQLSHKMSTSHFQMQAIVTVGSSTKKSFDQLLKNQ
jgi:hypothetical protein